MGLLTRFYGIYIVLKDFIRSLREKFIDQMAGKCLTDLCSEVRQRKWIIDPSYEFIVQAQT